MLLFLKSKQNENKTKLKEKQNKDDTKQALTN